MNTTFVAGHRSASIALLLVDVKVVPAASSNVGECVTVHGVRTSQVPRGGEMVPPHLDQHLLHLSQS
jgi:hypothetical protein